MSTNIPANILPLKGQQINKMKHSPDLQQILLYCRRDRCTKTLDPVTGKKARRLERYEFIDKGSRFCRLVSRPVPPYEHSGYFSSLKHTLENG